MNAECPDLRAFGHGCYLEAARIAGLNVPGKAGGRLVKDEQEILTGSDGLQGLFNKPKPLPRLMQPQVNHAPGIGWLGMIARSQEGMFPQRASSR